MKILLLLFSILRFTPILSQEKSIDTSTINHFIYVVPTSIFGHLQFDLSNTWIEIGYGYKYKKSMYGYGVSAIVYSERRSGSGLIWPGISSIASNGFSTSFEYKRVFVKRFYCSMQLNYEFMETIRPESYKDEFNKMINSYYKVFRNEITLIPRVGFVFLLRKDLSCDVNLGTGIRYIWSSNSGKKNPSINLEKEYLTNKVFDHGQKFAQRISLQFRVGYAF